MKIYLVGGAVRDQLLGLPVKERDWVVVGATPAQMLERGYRPVGKDFPVFLHPETHEEYALARTERKVGKGYTGFEFYAAPDVTLEDDLKRRDLTINAIAQTESGELIDPYGGQTDLQAKILRHVSSAFAEDPVRILRIARFASRFYDFTIHPDTLKLMHQMVEAGEVDALVAERVWQELVRTLAEPAPQRFFEILKDSGALKILFPELELSIQQLAALRKATQEDSSALVRFAALFYYVPAEQIDQLSARYRIPKEFRDLAILVSRHHKLYENLEAANAEQLLIVLETLDAFRRPERLQQFLHACAANHASEAASARLQKAFSFAKEITAKQLNTNGLDGKQIGEALYKARVMAIQEKEGN